MKGSWMFLLATAFAGAQELKGEIWSDHYPVENVTVNNISLKRFALTDATGKFSIVARAADTLEFSSLSMQPKMLIVTAEHLVDRVDIHLEPRTNSIEEVVVQRYRLTGNLNADSKNIKVKLPPQIALGISSQDIQKLQFTDDQQSAVTNIALPAEASPVYSVSLMPLFSGIGAKKKREALEARNLARHGDPFESRLRKKYTNEELGRKFSIPQDKVGLFVQFCSARASGNLSLFHPDNELLLTQFLLETALAFNSGE